MSIFKRQEALSIGARGEKAALAYLKKRGYKILDSNFCNTGGRRLGEIDIIAKDGEEIVFVEVKTRTSSDFKKPLPEESITPVKLYKLNKAASFYISKNQLFATPYRFDAVTLVADSENNRAALKHFKNIFI
jgi:putative endonuclease